MDLVLETLHTMRSLQADYQFKMADAKGKDLKFRNPLYRDLFAKHHSQMIHVTWYFGWLAGILQALLLFVLKGSGHYW